MINSYIKRSVYLTIFLVIGSFYPIIHLMILNITGLFSLIIPVSLIQNHLIYYFLNLMFSILFLFIFYNSNNLLLEAITQLISILFLIPFFLFLYIDMTSEEAKYYYMPHLVSSFLTGIVLLGVAFLKGKANKAVKR